MKSLKIYELTQYGDYPDLTYDLESSQTGGPPWRVEQHGSLMDLAKDYELSHLLIEQIAKLNKQLEQVKAKFIRQVMERSQ